MQRNSCPCCGNTLLRHARQDGLYWFCTSCRQAMALLPASQPLRLDSITLSSRAVQTVNS